MTDYDNLSNLPTPESFTQQIQISKGKLTGILDDYKKAYVNSNTDQNNNEYNTTHGINKSNVDAQIAGMTSINNEVLRAIGAYNSSLKDVNQKIVEAKIVNLSLKLKLGNTSNQLNGAGQMIGDYRLLYDIAYVRNWALGLSVVFACIVTSIIFYVPRGMKPAMVTQSEYDKLMKRNKELRLENLTRPNRIPSSNYNYNSSYDDNIRRNRAAVLEQLRRQGTRPQLRRPQGRR